MITQIFHEGIIIYKRWQTQLEKIIFELAALCGSRQLHNLTFKANIYTCENRDQGFVDLPFSSYDPVSIAF
jgi:hypothetical protein